MKQSKLGIPSVFLCAIMFFAAASGELATLLVAGYIFIAKEEELAVKSAKFTLLVYAAYLVIYYLLSFIGRFTSGMYDIINYFSYIKIFGFIALGIVAIITGYNSIKSSATKKDEKIEAKKDETKE